MGRLKRKWSRRHLAMAAIFLIACLLRLSWVEDMEYKGDERYTFEVTQRAGVTEPWPLLGMPTGVGTLNPGMSVWEFIAMKKLFGITTPVGLARAVIFFSLLGIALLLWIAETSAARERKEWLWATALGAVHPYEVQLHRKIWTLSTFPLLTASMILFFRYRARNWAAFALGCVGSIMGQIHLSGFFFTGAMGLWAMAFDRQFKKVAFLLGGVIGSLPLIPWIPTLFSKDHPHPGYDYLRIFQPKFWYLAFSNSLGLQLYHSLESQFWDYLRYPIVHGYPTYLVTGAYVLSSLIGFGLLGYAILGAWRERRRWRDWAIGRASSTAFTQNAILIGMGVLMALASVHVLRHYMAILFPITYLWFARVALRHPRGDQWLTGLACALLCMSGMFLYYIHVNHGASSADYGVAYIWQKR